MTAGLQTRLMAADRHAHTGMPGPEEQRPGARTYNLEGPKPGEPPLERDAG